MSPSLILRWKRGTLEVETGFEVETGSYTESLMWSIKAKRVFLVSLKGHHGSTMERAPQK